MDLRAIRVRSQTEMRSTLLDSGGKVIHVVTRVKKHDWFVFRWSAEGKNDEVGYLAEEISKQGVKGSAWVLLTAYSKIWQERDELDELKEE